MTAILDLVQGDICSTLVLVLLLALVGGAMVGGKPALHQWGKRLAGAAFVAYGVYGSVVFRPADASEWTDVALRGLLAGGLVLGVSWIFLPVVAFGYRHTLGALLPRVRDWSAATRRRSAERRARRDEEQERQRADEEWVRAAPERERTRQETEARARAQAAEQNRRKDARASCEIFFALHAPEIGKRFSCEMFDDFVARHLGDDHAPEYVEQRAQQLLELLRQHLDKVGAPQKKMALADLAQWFLREKQEIDKAALPPADKEVLLAALEERYTKLQEKFIRGLQP